MKLIKFKQMKNTIIIALLLFLTQIGQGQETLPITMEKVLELGGANNLTIKKYQEQQNLAIAELAKAKEWWLPDVYGGFDYNSRRGAVMNGNGKFFLDVKRHNFWMGLGVQANWDIAEGIYNKKAAELQSQATAYYT